MKSQTRGQRIAFVRRPGGGVDGRSGPGSEREYSEGEGAAERGRMRTNEVREQRGVESQGRGARGTARYGGGPTLPVGAAPAGGFPRAPGKGPRDETVPNAFGGEPRRDIACEACSVTLQLELRVGTFTM